MINIFIYHPITLPLERPKMRNRQKKKEKQNQIRNHRIPTNKPEGNPLRIEEEAIIRKIRKIRPNRKSYP